METDVHAYLEDFTRRDWQEIDEGTVRFAMLGLGWWTRDMAIPAVENSTFCETTVVVSSGKEKAEDVAAEHESVQAGITYDEFHEGVAADAYDAAYVCTPNATHLELVESAAEHGKAVLCEKPMEASAERAERMVEACEDADVPLMVAYRMQTDPAIRRMRELIDAGAIGDPQIVHGNMSQRLLEMIPDPDQWRLNPDLAGPGGSVTDLGVYSINTTRYVLDSDPVSVEATMGSSAEGYESIPDEVAAFTMTFPEGTYAACTASQNAHEAGQLQVVGTEGMVKLEPSFFNDDRRTLTVDAGTASAEIAIEPVDQMEIEFDHFAHCLLTDESPHADGRHGLTDMRVIEAVYEAAETGERVEL